MGPRARTAPLTWGQLSPWRLDAANAIAAPELLNRNNLSYHWSLPEPVTERACLRAIERLTARHEALRTSYPTSASTGEPYQSIQDEAGPRVEVADRKALVAEFGSVAAYVERTGELPFDIGARPPVRFTVVREDDGRVRELCFFVHHIVVDDWGVQFLWDDLTSLLASDSAPAARTPGNARRVEQPSDRARYESSAEGGARNARSLRHWDATLERCPPTPLPFCRVPFPEGENCTAEITSHVLGPALARLSRRARVPESHLCLALTALLYTAYTRTSGCVVHCLVSNRFTAPPSASCAFQIVPVALEPGAAGDLRELLERTRDEARALMLHGRYDLIERLALVLRKQAETSRNLFHRVEFNYVVPSRNTSGPPTAPEAERGAMPRRAAEAVPATRFRWALSQEDPLPDLFSVRFVNHKAEGVVDVRLGTNTAVADRTRCRELLDWLETAVLDLASGKRSLDAAGLASLSESVPRIELPPDAVPARYQGRPVDLAAVRRGLASAAPSATAIEVLCERAPSGEERLVACLAGDPGDAAVRTVRRGMLVAMEADPSVVMPDRFIVRRRPPEDPGRLDAWTAADREGDDGSEDDDRRGDGRDRYDGTGRTGPPQPARTAAERALADAVARCCGEAAVDLARSYPECSGDLGKAGEVVRLVREQGFTGVTHLGLATLTPLDEIAAAMRHT